MLRLVRKTIDDGAGRYAFLAVADHVGCWAAFVAAKAITPGPNPPEDRGDTVGPSS